jgi:mono/diheme cytochrome c family protein
MLQGIENRAKYKLSVAQCLQKHYYADELPVLMRVIDPSRTHFLKPISKMRFALGLIFSVCLLLPARGEEAIARGRYLAILGDCAGCHTEGHGPAFAGGLPFNTPFGTIYSTNITPDRDTGIGKWTAADFYSALHDGVAPGGKHLYPAFPYIYFRHVTRQDTTDLFAYLRAQKPVHREPTPNKLMFPMNLRFGMIFWNWLYFDKSPPETPAGASADWKRGDYIVNGLGHCAACHTPKTLLFGDQTGRPLGGGVVDHWFANNLAGGQAEGLGQWNLAEVVQFLATGINRHATAAGPMLEKVTASTSRMTAQDRAAIATYLKSLPPQKLAAFEPPRPEQMARGRGLYLAHCQACHAADGRPGGSGATAGYPNLAGDTLVMGRDPTTVLRLILTGGTAPPVPGHHPVKPMPGFAKLDDGMIADLASYVRNAWGNSAPVVDATQVHALRRAVKN